MKYVANPFTPIPKSTKSHVFGWADYWARSLGAQIYRGDFSDLKSTDEVYIDHGVNFSGSLNLFGGVSDEIVDRLIKLIGSGAEVISLDIDMPEYGAMVEKRLGAKSTSSKLTPTLVKCLKALFDGNTNGVDHLDVAASTGWWTIGDSHSTAFAPCRSGVFRNNGRTLKSFSGRLFHSTYLPTIQASAALVKGITLVFGSIDFRHHVMRYKRPKTYIEDLAKAYIGAASAIARETGIKQIELCAPMPVESESRKIPKTGYFKGTPFYGLREERLSATSYFIELLEKRSGSCYTLIMPPTGWYIMDPSKFERKHMELGGSVHLSPESYRSRGGWGV